ncbi:MAG: DNA topoisomerase IV subunit A [Bacilli bacterium]|nr:DNA topoisomerase IV subunit A [Bacilli bacterium]
MSEAILDKIYDYSLEEIMGERFGRYAKYIIQDRAIPDVRDGLKPVQRRILYGMYKDRNTYDHPYRKSAKTVGNVMGNYHPHGDSSIYEAMVRMSQWWKQNTTYIDMHGNNGSMDGDPPAAMRYTEARLAKISNELLKDLDRDTVVMAPNFDDTELEPTVLPAKFPNLLVNGTMGISAGYATNIPPHNLAEVIDATIKRIDSPNCRLDTIMDIVKGPDFPTGGIVEGIDEIRKAYETGKGRIVVKSRTKWEDVKGKLTLAITEIPYEVNKAQLVRKIDEIRIDKKIDGMVEVRDESDKDGLRIAIDCRKDANRELILNYLLKNTELQINYSFNMVAIVNRCPKLLGIIEIIDAYVEHLKDVIIRRTKFDLEHAKARYHIVEGLIKCLSILDEVIRVIRASKNRADAKENLIKEFDFTPEQSEAIITLQLYKLTNTDVTLLEEEMRNLEIMIKGLERILADEDVLKGVMKDELRRIKKEYSTPRKTDIVSEITTIKIDNTDMIQKEDVVVSVSRDGYIKCSSKRSYQASNGESTMKEGDYVLGLFELNTLDTILIFTDLGNYYFVPVHTIPTCAWKDLGKHLSNVIKLDSGEEIIGCLPVTEFDDRELLLSTKLGMIKRVKLSDFKTSKTLKPIVCMKLKDKDKLLTVSLVTSKEIFISTKKSYGLWYDVSEVPVVGLKTSGVKSINLKDDVVLNVSNFDINDEYLAVITNKGTGKRVKLSEFDKTSRAKRGLLLLREVKSNPYRVVGAYVVDNKTHLGIKTDTIELIKVTELPIMDRYSTGSSIVKGTVIDTFINQELKTEKTEKKEVDEVEEIVEPKKVSLKEIDERLMTIDDFIDIKE